jgi:hypothetical protein
MNQTDRRKEGREAGRVDEVEKGWEIKKKERERNFTFYFDHTLGSLFFFS